ncbi:hypothetical protein [Prauserella rugosa]|uniref:Uncharacterized protein n=1 Tax=Prauserella rugosa TaxID=43354 RepID=A0A660CGD2_9PSEU|nr:hypothetical protein [Prauserella rugosa]KMS90406.1 hypothetical protein ACZ91_15280 [Streptomyces regensis]TWH20061.1 hypothetical protein JD82_01901 [Prauserella rugosa]
MRDHRQPDRRSWSDEQEQYPKQPTSPDVPAPPNRDVLGGTEDVPEPPNRDDVDPEVPGSEREVQEGDDVTREAGNVEPPD